MHEKKYSDGEYWGLKGRKRSERGLHGSPAASADDRGFGFLSAGIRVACIRVICLFSCLLSVKMERS